MLSNDYPLISIWNHSQHFTNRGGYGRIRHCLMLFFLVHKMPMQFVTSAVDGSVSRLPPSANDWMMIWSPAVCIIYRLVCIHQAGFAFLTYYFLSKWWRTMKFTFAGFMCVWELPDIREEEFMRDLRAGKVRLSETNRVQIVLFNVL